MWTHASSRCISYPSNTTSHCVPWYVGFKFILKMADSLIFTPQHRVAQTITINISYFLITSGFTAQSFNEETRTRSLVDVVGQTNGSPLQSRFNLIGLFEMCLCGCSNSNIRLLQVCRTYHSSDARSFFRANRISGLLCTRSTCNMPPQPTRQTSRRTCTRLSRTPLRKHGPAAEARSLAVP